MSYLVHHGIKGQKWGVRRYQNEDGTLIEAGKDSKIKDNVLKRHIMGNTRSGSFMFKKGGMRAHREELVDKYKRRADKAESHGNMLKAERNRKKANAQAAANADRDAYDSRTSTGKAYIQNLLMTPSQAENYRMARARGASRGRAFLESRPGVFSFILRRSGERKAYGAHVRLGVGGGEV